MGIPNIKFQVGVLLLLQLSFVLMALVNFLPYADKERKKEREQEKEKERKKLKN